MTIMNALSLNAREQQIVVKKIKDRVTSKFNLAADFSKLNAIKVDFTPEEVQAKEKWIGSQFTVPIRTFEGLDGDVQYVEFNNSYFYNVATKTKNTTLVKTLRQSTTTNNEKLERIVNHIKAQGYSIKKEEENLFGEIVNNDHLDEHVTCPILYDALNLLTKKQKEIINLAYVEGLSDTEIGLKLNKTQQAISKTHKKALESMLNYVQNHKRKDC